MNSVLAIAGPELDSAREIAHGLRGVNQKLEQQFDQAAASAERSFRPAKPAGIRPAAREMR
jgi:hypothetical protein